MKKLGELEVTDRKKLVLSIGEYRDQERVDLREYLLNDKDWIPTKKGINLNSEWLPDFIKLMKKLEEE